MSQSRRHSFLEAWLNTLSGFVLSLLLGHFLFPAMGWKLTFGDNLTVTGVYTVVSIARTYCWRRAFNWWQHRNVDWFRPRKAEEYKVRIEAGGLIVTHTCTSHGEVLAVVASAKAQGLKATVVTPCL